jgi:hypothetical protein
VTLDRRVSQLEVTLDRRVSQLEVTLSAVDPKDGRDTDLPGLAE